MSLSDEPNNASPESSPMGSGSAVGYKKPPKANQFKPGQSGNPKGRPKGSTSTAMLLKKVLAKQITVTENGKTKKISLDEAIIHALTAKAAKGDHKSAKLTIELKDRFGLNNINPPLTNIVVSFVDPDPEKQAAYKREDELFDQLDREKQNSVVTEIPHSN